MRRGILRPRYGPAPAARQEPLVGKDSQVVISVAVVAHCDEGIEAFLRETTAILAKNYQYYEILIVDNGSDAEFRKRVQELQQTLPNLRMLCLSREYDREAAYMAALDNAIGDYVVLMEIDGDPPGLIPEFVQAAIDGCDVVIGKTRRVDELPWHLRMGSRLYHSLAKRMLEFPVRESASYFRVMSRAVVNSMTRIRNKRRYLKYLNSMVGYRQKHVPYTRVFRGGRTRRDGALRSLGRAIDVLISNSAIPLRAASLLGVAACGLNLLYLGYIFVITLIKKQLAEGWLSTSIMNTTMFFFVFLILTVLSEYVLRILEETRDRPLYFIDFETTSNVNSFQKTIEAEHVNVV